MLKVIGMVLAIGVGLLVVWWLVDLAWYAWGGLGALIFSFALIFFVVYLVDRRKVKESEDLIAQSERFS